MATAETLARVYLAIPADLYYRLQDAWDPAGGESWEDFMERAVGAPETWPLAAVTPKPRPAPTSAPKPRVLTRSITVPPTSCACCKVRCRLPWVWRNVERCTCTPAKLAALARQERRDQATAGAAAARSARAARRA